MPKLNQTKTKYQWKTIFAPDMIREVLKNLRKKHPLTLRQGTQQHLKLNKYKLKMREHFSSAGLAKIKQFDNTLFGL